MIKRGSLEAGMKMLLWFFCEFFTILDSRECGNRQPILFIGLN
jgi:hypothetical protein